MSKILEVDNLCKSFMVKKRLLDENDAVSAVNHVPLGLEEGEVLGIVGESDCGKSTIARLLPHNTRPDSDIMKLYGKKYDMARATRQDVQAFRKNMQMVFQNPYSSLNPKMSVLQNITFDLTTNQVSRDEACRRTYCYLDAIGMQKSSLSKYSSSLSDGQRQRMAAVRTLAMEPKIILADEPVSALDKSVQARVLDLFHDLQKESGISVIFISHDLSVAKCMSDHIAVLYPNEVIEYSTSEKLYHNPGHPYTKELLRSIPQTSGDAHLSTANREPPIGLPNLVRPPSGCQYHPRCPYRTENYSKHIPAPVLAGRDHIVKCHHCATQSQPIEPVEGSLI